MLEFKECVGKRLLVKRANAWFTDHPSEVKVVEISPSGEFVKLLMPDGYKHWHDVGAFVVVEALPDIKENRRSTDYKEETINVA